MDLVTAQTNLDKWIAADTATTGGAAYSIDGLSLTRVDAPLITSKINFWQKIVNEHTDFDSGRPAGQRVASWN